MELTYLFCLCLLSLASTVFTMSGSPLNMMAPSQIPLTFEKFIASTSYAPIDSNNDSIQIPSLEPIASSIISDDKIEGSLSLDQTVQPLSYRLENIMLPNAHEAYIEKQLENSHLISNYRDESECATTSRYSITVLKRYFGLESVGNDDILKLIVGTILVILVGRSAFDLTSTKKAGTTTGVESNSLNGLRRNESDGIYDYVTRPEVTFEEQASKFPTNIYILDDDNHSFTNIPSDAIIIYA